jgi:Uma2 family endonuclease
MTSFLSKPLVYPSSDGEPVAETYTHLYAILTILEMLRQYLQGRRATVLANQFLYYAEGFPKLRVAPDVMVIFEVEPGGRDNYKIWEEGRVPSVVFEITSPATQREDREVKKSLYQNLEIPEYWLFDPKGEWIEEKLRGYRLQGDSYQLVTDNRSEALQLRLAVEGELLAFYREDTGEKLLNPDELAQAKREAEARANRERQRAENLEEMLARYRERFGDLPED